MSGKLIENVQKHREIKFAIKDEGDYLVSQLNSYVTKTVSWKIVSHWNDKNETCEVQINLFTFFHWISALRYIKILVRHHTWGLNRGNKLQEMANYKGNDHI